MLPPAHGMSNSYKQTQNSLQFYGGSPKPSGAKVFDKRSHQSINTIQVVTNITLSDNSKLPKISSTKNKQQAANKFSTIGGSETTLSKSRQYNASKGNGNSIDKMQGLLKTNFTSSQQNIKSFVNQNIQAKEGQKESVERNQFNQSIHGDATNILKLADESLAILDKEIKKQEAKKKLTSQKPTRQEINSMSDQKRLTGNSAFDQISQQLGKNPGSSFDLRDFKKTQAALTNQASIKTQAEEISNENDSPQQQQFNRIQSAQVQVRAIKVILQKLQDFDGKLQKSRGKECFRFICECIDELKAAIPSKEFHAVASYVIRALSFTSNKILDKAKSRKFLI